MIATILTFAISLLLVVALLSYKIVRLRRGELMPEHDFSPLSFVPEHVSYENFQKSFIEHAQKYGHEMIVFALRVWFKAAYFVKREKNAIVHTVKTWLPKKHKEASKRAVSHFLQNVAEYKAKLREMKDKVKEEEGKNF